MLVAAPAMAASNTALPVLITGNAEPMPPATPPPNAPTARSCSVMGLPVTKFMPAVVTPPVIAPLMMGLVTPRLANTLVMGFRLAPEKIDEAVPAAVPVAVPELARLLIMAGSIVAISSAVCAAFKMFNSPAAGSTPDDKPVATLAAASAAPASMPMVPLNSVAISAALMPDSARLVAAVATSPATPVPKIPDPISMLAPAMITTSLPKSPRLRPSSFSSAARAAYAAWSTARFELLIALIC